MMRVLVTRPRADAENTVQRLTARGIEAVVEPILDIRFLPVPPIDTAGAQAFLATSANGVRALAAATPERALPLFAVGEASAAVARDLGFAPVRAASGDVNGLAALAAEVLSPAGGALIQAAASVEAGDLSGRLTDAGFEVRKIKLYESRAAESLSPALVEGLKSARIDAAMFFSPRTARTFVTLAETAGVAEALMSVAAYALSPAVAGALRTVEWRAVRVSPRPEQKALFAIFDADRTAGKS
jgi:uroporphyrinogen-III synthase